MTVGKGLGNKEAGKMAVKTGNECLIGHCG